MRHNIHFVAAVTCLLSVSPVAGAELPAAERDDSVPRYRVIFNCDGHAVAKDAAGDLEQWIKNLFGPLEKSHVEALFWCDGAGGNTANYQSDVLERTGVRAAKPRTYIDDWIAGGNDPPKVVVREAHQRGLDVYFSFRINDIHDSFMPDEMATFKVENPDWMLGKQDYGGVTSFPSSLNFAVPGVRDLKFRIVEEIFQKYDFDGLEVDFLRSAPYFMPGTEDQHAHLLTEMLQRIRKHLVAKGTQRGRPIRLAVRVDESLASCRLNGFDVRAWIARDLVDMIALGSGVMDIEVEEFKQLATEHGVYVYPCLYGWPSQYNPISAELATGLALNYWAQGADGIYLFNWFPHTKNNSESTGPFMTGLMKHLGDPASLRSSQRRIMFPADRGRPQSAYQYNWLHSVLPAALPADKPLRAVVRAFEEFPDGVNLKLRLHVENLRADDQIAVQLNGQSVMDWKREGDATLTAAVAPALLRRGANQVDMQLVKRAPASTDRRVVTALELHAVRE